MTTRFAVDDLVIHRIVEQETPSPDEAYRPQVFFPDLTDAMLEANRGWLTGNGLDPVYGNVLLCYQTYIVRTPHHTVLIDTCIGNDKNHPARPHWHGKTDATYMRALATAGLTVEDIDFVMCTHLHADHVGWNTRLLDGRWVPTFPNARYLFQKADWDYFTNPSFLDDPAPRNPAQAQIIRNCVLPLEHTGLMDIVGPEYQVTDEVTLLHTPGHTPGSVTVLVQSRDEAALLIGDAAHHPAELTEHDWSPVADIDPSLSARSRKAIVEEARKRNGLIGGSHFPEGAPFFGRIQQIEGRMLWQGVSL